MPCIRRHDFLGGYMKTSILSRTDYEVWEIDGKFWPVQRYSNFQVVDIGGRDKPPSPSSNYIARRCEAGVKYVSSPSPTRRAALARICRAFSRSVRLFDSESSDA